MTTLKAHGWWKATLTGVFFLIIVFCSALSFGQTAGARLEGIIKDPTGAIIPGVALTATNEKTNVSYASVSNESGFYVFVNLPPGSYRLSAELQGFKRHVSKGIELKVADTAALNIALEIGDVSTEVEVSAAAPLIDTTSSKIGSVVQERQILDLPLNGRNAMMLYYLQAGTNPRDSLGGQQAVGSVDGLRTNASNTRIEGVWASDASYDMSPAAPNVAVPLEAVGEYRVTTSSASAEMGRGAGAQVQVVYRSGTNSFHGSAYEFNRNTVYNANDFFRNRSASATDRARPPVFQRNQYGASLGGPIRRDKTFFFGNWEGQRQIQASVENYLVYTQALRDGIFRFNTAKANSTADVDPTTGNPLVPFKTIEIYKADPTRLGMDTSGIVAAKLKQILLPNNYDIGDGFNLAGYRFTSSNPNHGNQAVVKIDHSLSTRHQLSGAIGGYWFRSGDAYMFSGYRSFESREKKRNAMIGLVSGLKPNLTNEFRIGATRRLTDTVPGNPGNFDPKGNFQLSGLGSGRGGGTNGNPLGVYLPQRNPIDAYNLNDNVAWVLKNHTIKVGFEVTHTTKNNWFGGDEYIPTIYTSTTNNPAAIPASVTGIASADRSRAQQMINDLTGTIGHINQTYNANSLLLGFVPYDTRHRLLRQREWGAFFQDTWKAAQNLTVNYGLRWDVLPPAWMHNGVYTYPKGGSKAVFGVSGPLGTYATDLAPNKGKDIIEWDWNNFGPHVGFTWDPFKDGKSSVSAYFRVSYDRQMQSVYSRVEDQNQGMNIDRQAIPFTRFSDPNLYQAVGGKPAILPLPVGKPFAPLPFTREGRAYALDENIRTPYTQSWSLRIQRELVRNWFIQVAYVGNTSVGGWRAINYNQIEIRKNGFFEGFLAAQRNLAATGNANKGESIGVLATLFAPMGGVPSAQNTNISQGQVATLANYADTTVFNNVRGGLVTASGLPITFFRVNPQVANATICDNLSVSSWHGMKLEVGKRFSQGTYLQFNYTLGKGLTDYVGGQGQYDDFRDNLNRRLDKTLQAYDSTHIIQSNGIWELPFGAGKRWLTSASGWKQAVLGGWQINGIFQLATSRPFTIGTGRYNLTLGDDGTANYSGKDFNIASKVIKGDQILAITAEEKALFSNPTAGSPGGTPQRAFRGPLYTNVDTSVFKNFRVPFLGEQGIVQFRAEAFNLFNHANFGLPTSNMNSGSFGQISSAYAPRILQFALKVNF